MTGWMTRDNQVDNWVDNWVDNPVDNRVDNRVDNQAIHGVLPQISFAAAIGKLATICHGKNGKSGKAKKLK